MTAQQSPEPKSHIAALDGVRGLAILSVLMVHSFPDLKAELGDLDDVLHTVVDVGPFGVDLFFVLSGFLITGILLGHKEGAHYFKNFYARRVLRLFPVYYLYLILVMTVVPWMHKVSGTSMPDYDGNWWWYLTYFTNWKPNFAVGDHYLGHFWSLAVEEQFYMVWPLVVLKTSRRQLVFVCFGLILSALALRLIWWGQGAPWNQIYRLTVTRWDTMAMGALAAIAVRSEAFLPRAARWARPMLAGGLGVFVALAIASGTPAWHAPLIQTIGTTFASIGFTGLVLYAATRQTGALDRVLRVRPLLALGKYSYCIYVIHLLIVGHVGWLTRYALKRAPSVPVVPAMLAQALFADVLVFVVAVFSFKYFESKLLSLKRYFEA